MGPACMPNVLSPTTQFFIPARIYQSSTRDLRHKNDMLQILPYEKMYLVLVYDRNPLVFSLAQRPCRMGDGMLHNIRSVLCPVRFLSWSYGMQISSIDQTFWPMHVVLVAVVDVILLKTYYKNYKTIYSVFSTKNP